MIYVAFLKLYFAQDFVHVLTYAYIMLLPVLLLFFKVMLCVNEFAMKSDILRGEKKKSLTMRLSKSISPCKKK